MKTGGKLILAVIAIILVAVALAYLPQPGAESAQAPADGATEGQKTLQAAFDAEFHVRPDGYKGLCTHYGFQFPEEPKQMDAGLMYKACADGAVDIIDAFATDGRIKAYDLFVLEDDKQFFPPYYAAPLVRAETLEKYPQIKTALASLGGALNDDIMRELNCRVDENGEKAHEVARSFLVKKGLLAEDAKPGSGSAGSVRIGGKQFTEQEILGELMAQLIECKTDVAVERKLNLGGTMICFNALKAGDLDLYSEYTGTGLVNILEKPVENDPDKAFQIVKDAFAKEYKLIWLNPFGFNNTYTLTMRKNAAGKLGIITISDLAKQINGK